jgi:hypothetical protein
MTDDHVPLPRHALINAITAVVAASGLLDERWEQLDDHQRRDLASTVRRRTEELRRLVDGR